MENSRKDGSVGVRGHLPDDARDDISEFKHGEMRGQGLIRGMINRVELVIICLEFEGEVQDHPILEEQLVRDSCNGGDL